MLEVDQVLRTWALADAPAPGAVIAAEQLPDHRLGYLDYEGPVSGDRGSVSRWDSGQFTILNESPGSIVMLFAGERLQCHASLRRQQDGSANWEFSVES
jgi:DNA polymerase ligase (LigD)-like protein